MVLVLLSFMKKEKYQNVNSEIMLWCFIWALITLELQDYFLVFYKQNRATALFWHKVAL